MPYAGALRLKSPFPLTWWVDSSDSQMGKLIESSNYFWFLASGWGYRVEDSGYILEAWLLAAYGQLASGVAAWLCVWDCCWNVRPSRP